LPAPKLTERQRLILKAIVDDYVNEAEPVGSRTISRRHLRDVSPATIRNDMADLEELGFLEQPHTSAGRVPTDAGYRFYVDEILEESPVPDDRVRVIERALRARARQAEELVKATVRVLSETSNLISIVLGPQVAPASLARIEIVPTDEGRALLVLFSDTGFVETKLVYVPESLDAVKLRQVTEHINGLLQGHTWEALSRPTVFKDLKNALHGYEAMLDDTIEFLRASLQPVASERVFISGVVRLLDLPEFQSPERVKPVLGILDHGQVVSRMLLEHLEDGVTATIGRENKQAEMAECSLISAPYHLGRRPVGCVAVLGPKRMDYGLLLSLVDLVALNLDDALERMA